MTEARKPNTWQDANRDLLAALDIRAEYERLGLRIACGATARASGWLACHAFDREDRNPSAEINIGDGPGRGRYRDFGGSAESMGFWDFAAKYGPAAGWRNARKHYARQAGVKLPSGSDNRLIDRFEFFDLTPGLSLVWATRKPPISIRAIEQAGGRGARWPAKLLPEHSQTLIAFPMYGGGLLARDAQSWHSVNVGGGKVRIFQGKGKPLKLAKTMTSGSPGLMNVWALRHLADAEVVWLVEGLTDMLTMQTALGERVDHVVVSGGACSYHPQDSWLKLFTGKDVRICFDIDAPEDGKKAGPGEIGAAVWASQVVKTATAVRNVRLPFEPDDSQSDLRDFFQGGRTYGDLWRLSESHEPIEGDGNESLGDLVDDDVVANAFAPDGDTTIGLTMETIIGRLKEQADDWPRRVGSALFVEQIAGTMGSVYFLDRPYDLFGFLHLKVGRVHWHRGHDCANREDLFASLRQSATQYESVESFPHFPALDGIYYGHRSIKHGDGTALAGFVDRFTPDADVDQDLIKAAIVTLLWGGAPGARPAFIFTSDDGRGAGKTKTAEMLAYLVGGTFDFSKGEDVATIKKRLLTTAAATKRCCLLDNIKTTRFSWAEFEAMVTAREISGHQLYAGERSRLNVMTWLLTLNGPALSRDIAQRVIPIKIRRPEKYTADWEEKTRQYVDRHRWRIIGDVASLLDETPADFEVRSRWASWENHVLGRMAEPAECQRTIAERQAEFDVDTEEQLDVEDYFRQQLKSLHYDPEMDIIHIPNIVAARWYSQATNTKPSATKISRAIKQGSLDGTLCNLKLNPSKAKGRGLLWTGKDAMAGSPVYYDVDQRFRSTDKRENPIDYFPT